MSRLELMTLRGTGSIWCLQGSVTCTRVDSGYPGCEHNGSERWTLNFRLALLHINLSLSFPPSFSHSLSPRSIHTARNWTLNYRCNHSNCSRNINNINVKGKQHWLKSRNRRRKGEENEEEEIAERWRVRKRMREGGRGIWKWQLTCVLWYISHLLIAGFSVIPWHVVVLWHRQGGSAGPIHKPSLTPEVYRKYDELDMSSYQQHLYW